jgi:hypothetical protein
MKEQAIFWVVIWTLSNLLRTMIIYWNQVFDFFLRAMIAPVKNLHWYPASLVQFLIPTQHLITDVGWEFDFVNKHNFQFLNIWKSQNSQLWCFWSKNYNWRTTICHYAHGAQNFKEPEVIKEGLVKASSAVAVYSWWLFDFKIFLPSRLYSKVICKVTLSFTPYSPLSMVSTK